MLDLIQELTESRIFFNADTLKGKDIHTLAELAFCMTMALEIMRYTKEKVARNYADQTFKYQDFDKMYYSPTDLYNLLVVIGNQTDFEDKITTDLGVSFPKMGYKRYLRDIIAGRRDHNTDRSFFYRLEQAFKIGDSSLKQIRRIVADWKTADRGEREYIKKQLDLKFRKLSQYVDINRIFIDIRID